MDVGPGDRVICVRGGTCAHGTGARVETGAIYTVDSIDFGRKVTGEGALGLVLTAPETRLDSFGNDVACWDTSRFRKLPDISEWLETSTDFEEPRRVPAPREVEGV